MASDIARSFHSQSRAIAHQFANDRIQYGTKASTPQVRAARRLNPLNYSNPLPDNSSGSKIRPFFENKDESGRPNAMELVAMRQAKQTALTGGVLKDYKYAQMILKRRAQDTENIKLASQQLPPQFSDLLELTDIDKQKLSLNQVITKIQDDLDTGDVNNLTFESMKNLSRALIVLAPTFNEQDITQLSQVFDDMLLTINSRVDNQGIRAEIEQARSARGIKTYIENMINPFIEVLARAIRLPETAKRSLITSAARQLFAEIAPPALEGMSDKLDEIYRFGENLADSINDYVRYFAKARRGPLAVLNNTARTITEYVAFISGQPFKKQFINEYVAGTRDAPVSDYGFQQIFRQYLEEVVQPTLEKVQTEREADAIYKLFKRKVKTEPSNDFAEEEEAPEEEEEAPEEEVAEEEEAEAEEEGIRQLSEEELAILTVNDLKELLRSYGLIQTGNRAVLLQRIRDFYGRQ